MLFCFYWCCIFIKQGLSWLTLFVLYGTDVMRIRLSAHTPDLIPRGFCCWPFQGGTPMFPLNMFVPCFCNPFVFSLIYIHVVTMSWFCTVRIVLCYVCYGSCMYPFLSLDSNTPRRFLSSSWSEWNSCRSIHLQALARVLMKSLEVEFDVPGMFQCYSILISSHTGAVGI